MRTLRLMVGLLLVGGAIGCKGPKGEQGPQGVQGDPGPGRIVTQSGRATSNAYKIFDSRVDSKSAVTVYIGSDNKRWSESPMFDPALGYSIGYILEPGIITLYNLVDGGTPYYSVVMIFPNTAPMPSSYGFGSRLLE